MSGSEGGGGGRISDEDGDEENVVELVGLDGRQREPNPDLVNMVRGLLVQARSGELRALSIQLVSIDEDGKKLIKHAWEISDEIRSVNILDAIEQHAFSIRMSMYNESYSCNKVHPEQGTVEGDDSEDSSDDDDLDPK